MPWEKRTLQADGAEDPAAKAAKLEEPKTEDAEMEGAKRQEANAEKEQDAPADKRKALAEQVAMQPRDSTLNLVPTAGGSLLMALSDAGLQYLVAAARANVGVKAGRYLYETRIMEVLNPAEVGRRPTSIPKQHVRVGFSVPGSSLFLGEEEGGVCFDSEGSFISDRKRSPVSQRFARGQVIAVLLNLDPNSPNANTVSLFRDGQRISEPQALPAALRGKPLCPHVSFRNVSLHVHFGPELLHPLPFKCRALQAAAQDDVVVSPTPKPTGGKYEVIFPVALPDEGTFSWLEGFLEKNPHYIELSDRKIVEWAEKSGLHKQKTNQMKTSNDRPDVSFGVPALDDLSARKVLRTIASLVPRNYVVMEVKSNLLKADRADLVRKFSDLHFRRVAQVIMGEPADEFKAKVRAALLEEKQEKLDAEWKQKQAERERKRQIEQRQKQLIEQRKAALAAQMKASEESGEASSAAEKKKEGEEGAEKAEGGEAMQTDTQEKKEVKDEAKQETKDELKEEEQEAKEGAKKEEAKKEEVKKEEPPEADVEMKDKEDDGPRKAELSEEEAKLWFKPQPTSDLTLAATNSSFAHFTIPSKDEGFDEVRYEWQDEAASKAYLRSWVLEKKLTTRVEDIQPSEWFATKLADWQKILQEWQMKQKEFRQDPSRREAAKQRIQKEKARKAKERLEREKKEKEAEGGKEQEGEEKADAEAQGDKAAAEEDQASGAAGEKEEAKAPAEEKAEEEDEGEPPDDEELPALDIFTVKDICDIGDGEPLFANFMFEDWALMSLRFELLLLVKSFKKDVNDDDRPGMPEAHLPFYYNKYYRKQLNTRFFGMNTTAELVNMVKDTVAINDSDSIIVSQLPEDTEPVSDIFVKLTEESRRDRQRRIDAGDETAKLKFSVLASPQQQPEQRQQPRVVVGNSAPRAYHSQWGQGARPMWQRPGYGSQGFKGSLGVRWPSQAYAPKQQGWR